MARKKMSTRVSDEMERLTKFYADLAPDKRGIAEGLIERAAWMRVQCEDLEKYLNENGWTAPFQQSDKLPPYDRARPQGQTYNTLNANYQKIIKQLDAMLPKSSETVDTGDGFEKFVLERDVK